MDNIKRNMVELHTIFIKLLADVAQLVGAVEYTECISAEW